jgi:hypothetical protein
MRISRKEKDMQKNSYVKYAFAIVFVVSLFSIAFRNDIVSNVREVYQYLRHPRNYESVASVEEDYCDRFQWKEEMVELNGFFARTMGMKEFYSDMGMFITEDKSIITISEYTTTDYEVEQTIAFQKFLAENGISFLYVNQPTKYLDDEAITKEFGKPTYSNRNADLYIQRIREANVPAIDLRENMREEGLQCSDLFFRTDHHWTVPAGLWAAGKMINGLNEYCGYHVDPSLYDINRYEVNQWTSCWLGEQGKKVSQSYVGLDDFTELKPKFKTDFTFYWEGVAYPGDFNNLIDERVYNTSADVFTASSWYYSYHMENNIINNDVPDGKVLLLCDSYAIVTKPFLLLGVHDLDAICLREMEESFDLRQYILDNQYDTVIVAYAQFMIGAHDDPSSSNYRMFSFD